MDGWLRSFYRVFSKFLCSKCLHCREKDSGVSKKSKESLKIRKKNEFLRFPQKFFGFFEIVSKCHFKAFEDP